VGFVVISRGEKKAQPIQLQVNSPGVSPWPRTPGAHPVVGTDEVVARKHGVVTVGESLDQASAYIGPAAAVAAPVVRAERVAEGARGRGKERGWKWPRCPLRKEGDASVEAKRQLGEGRRVQPAVVIQGWIRRVGGRRRRLLVGCSVGVPACQRRNLGTERCRCCQNARRLALFGPGPVGSARSATRP
jgi:hypothetical protein